MTPPGKRRLARDAARIRQQIAADHVVTAEGQAAGLLLLDADRFAMNELAKKAKPYLLIVGWKCSMACGKPIQFGQMCVTTSKDLKPWERAHAACVAVRKGADSTRTEDGTPVELRATA